ncbi:unnamed protein product [Cylindrotheca closterium]|uniref:Uncharacterized protein n=1 Tax=Cylindrotheca closterium TaxID=2856 RepID=A0AAD2G815_9STRA|nr:unnamed protein product [Cylindrotheca closterium]
MMFVLLLQPFLGEAFQLSPSSSIQHPPTTVGLFSATVGTRKADATVTTTDEEPQMSAAPWDGQFEELLAFKEEYGQLQHLRRNTQD